MGATTDLDSPSPRHDPWTVVAIAVVAYALDNVLHEGLGHGGAALLVGAKPKLLTSLHLAWTSESLPEWCGRFIAAGGTLVNVIAGFAARWLGRKATCANRFFWWVFASVSFLQASGYLLYSGLTGIGDWARVVDGYEPVWLWRGGLAVAGAGLYLWVVTLSMRWLAPFLGESRVKDGFRLTLVCYATGGALYVLSGLFNPEGPLLMLISGAAASLGGTSGFAWGPSMLGDPYFAAPPPRVLVARSVPWIVAGVLVAAVFIGVLGPGIALG